MTKEGFLSHVEIKEQLGKGKYGKVYELDNQGEKEAMKVIDVFPKNKESNEILGISNREELEKQTEKIMKEIGILYSLRGNTHIVNYIDHYIEKTEDKFTLYLEMEYLKALSIYYPDDIKQDEVTKISEELLEGLILCEDNDIIHGDIKPQNIMVDEAGNTKLTDFGISRYMSEGIRANASTPIYGAPEVIEEGKYTRQSDIYSLGVVLYQLYNDGKLPYKKIKKGEFPKGKKMDNEFYEFILKAVNNKPEERYASAKEMQEELERMKREGHIPETIVSLGLMMMIANEIAGMTAATNVATGAAQAAVSESIKVVGKKALLAKVLIAGSIAVGGGYYVYTNSGNGINLTENLRYEVLGTKDEGYIKIIDNDIENIDESKLITGYDFSQNENLVEGDTVTITVLYDEEYAKENDIRVGKDKLDIKISDLPENYQETEYTTVLEQIIDQANDDTDALVRILEYNSKTLNSQEYVYTYKTDDSLFTVHKKGFEWKEDNNYCKYAKIYQTDRNAHTVNLTASKGDDHVYVHKRLEYPETNYVERTMHETNIMNIYYNAANSKSSMDPYQMSFDKEKKEAVFVYNWMGTKECIVNKDARLVSYKEFGRIECKFFNFNYQPQFTSKGVMDKLLSYENESYEASKSEYDKDFDLKK